MFPSGSYTSGNTKGFNETPLGDTILDGELVIDVIETEQVSIMLTFSLFDVSWS